MIQTVKNQSDQANAALKPDWDPAEPPRLAEAVGVVALLLLGGVCCWMLYGSMIWAMIASLLPSQTSAP